MTAAPEELVTDATEQLSARIDDLSAKMDWMMAQMERQNRAQEKWSDLADTMVPVTRGAMDVATRELEEISQQVTVDDLTRFLKTLVVSLPQLEGLLLQLGSLSELLSELTTVSSAGMGKLTDVLQEAEDKGYFAFARQGSRIADRIVTEFSEDDVAALGDNVVTILNAVKEMTQPEVMGLVQRTAITMKDTQDVHEEPPSLFAIVKSMRDPDTRRGLSRVISMLHSVGEEQPSLTQGEQGRK